MNSRLTSWSCLSLHGLGIKRQAQPYLTVSIRLPGALFSEELTLGYSLLKVDRFSVDCTLG